MCQQIENPGQYDSLRCSSDDRMYCFMGERSGKIRVYTVYPVKVNNRMLI